MGFLNNFMTLESLQCNFRTDFVDDLIRGTVTPLLLVGVLIIVISLHGFIQRGNLRKVVGMYINVALWLYYLILPSTTTFIFEMFLCEDIDTSNFVPGTPRYMRKDYSVSCSSSRYSFGFVWAVVMIFAYPINVLLLYYWLLYYHRDNIRKLQEEKYNNIDEIRQPSGSLSSSDSIQDTDNVECAEEDISTSKGCMKYVDVKDISFLYKAYRAEYWYWEIIETTRRLFMTAVLSVIGDDSSSRIIFGMMITLFFIKLYEYYQPYGNNEVSTMQEIAQFQVFLTLFVALMIVTGKMNTSTYVNKYNRSDTTKFCHVESLFYHFFRPGALSGSRWNEALDVMLVFANMSTLSWMLWTIFNQFRYTWKKKSDTKQKVYDIEVSAVCVDEQSNINNDMAVNNPIRNDLTNWRPPLDGQSGFQQIRTLPTASREIDIAPNDSNNSIYMNASCDTEDFLLTNPTYNKESFVRSGSLSRRLSHIDISLESDEAVVNLSDSTIRQQQSEIDNLKKQLAVLMEKVESSTKNNSDLKGTNDDPGPLSTGIRTLPRKSDPMTQSFLIRNPGYSNKVHIDNDS